MKLHPLSFPYRAGRRGLSVASTLVFLGLMLSRVTDVVNLLVAALVTAAGLLLTVGWELAYYRRFDYALTETSLDIESGVVSRRRREIPIQRVQNVDIRRNVVQRVLGIAAVNLETAGGGQTEASLRFVGYDEAKRLQREIQRRKRATEEADVEETEADEPASEETVLYEIGSAELALLSIVSFEPRVVGLAFFLVPLFTGATDSFASVTVLVGALQLLFSALVLWVASAMVTFTRYYDFRLTRVGDELRYERGLLQRYDGSIPLDKIQALAVRENPLMRLAGYAALSVETAGYAPGGGPSGGSEAAVPLAVRERTLALASDIQPFEEPTFERPPTRARRRYAIRYALAVGAVTALAFGVDRLTGWIGSWPAVLALVVFAPVAAHYRWKHRGYHAGHHYVVTRNGFWRRTTKVVPYYRVQTVVQRATVFQRRWRIATVVADTASSVGLTGDDARAVDLDAADATELRELVARRLHREIRRRTTDRSRTGGERTDAAFDGGR